jgi:tetratricopeptide (TPR) repeat protein
MTVTVETDTMATLPRSISASHTELLNVVVSSDNMTKLRGVLQDADGHPIRDAKIKVKRSIGTNRNWGERIVRFDGQESFNANEKGEFVTPKLLPRYAKYILTCEAPAFLAKSTSYVMAPERGDLDLGVIELIRSRTITGQVVNSKGEPIGGVEVKAWSADKDQSRGASTRVAATTDDQGKFQLANIHPQAALATLKKDGFRQSGFSLVRPDTVTKARMYRLDEQIREPDRVVLNRLTERHRSAALTLIEKLAPTRRNSNYFHKILIDMMAKVDRELLTKELAKTNKASSRSLILAELGEFEDALAELEEIENGYRRGFSRFAVLDRIDDADLVADVLANAAIDAESVLQPDRRLAVVAHVAERLYAAGDVDTARKILFDQRELAGSLSPKDWPGFARASFAERLALFDLDTALKMIAEMDAKDHSRHYQNIAHMIAERNPKGAIKALKCIEKNRSIGSPTIRVGYRMAKSKLENALQLESMIDTNRFNVGKSQLLGVISYSIKEENPDKSKELLSRAFTDLPGRGHNMGYQSEMLFGAGLALLRYAEEIAPENLDQHFWQAYETYQGPSGNSWSAGDRTEVDADRQARLAILLWLYGFEELAKQSAASAFEYWENKIKQADEKSYRFRDRQASFVAMALTNPARAVDFAVQCDETLSKEMLRRIPQPWEVIGQSLTMERWDLGQMLSKELFHLWTIDNYDL